MTTPGVKEEITGGDERLEGQEASKYRATNYLSQDRSDIAYEVKELSRGMAKPTEGDWGKAKRLGRYLRGRPRVIVRFPYREWDQT